IGQYCREARLAQDVFDEARSVRGDATPLDGGAGARSGATSVSAARSRAFELLLQGQSIDSVAAAVSRAQSTVLQYLVELIARDQICDPSAWLEAGTFERIRCAVARLGPTPLKPLFESFGGEIPYDQIRIAVACMRNAPPEMQGVATLTGETLEA